MAWLYLSTTSVSRTAGRTAPGAAAYRAGERIRDERTGTLYNYSRRTDVSHKEIIVPPALEASAPEWARQRAALWNAAEAAERPRNARVAREYLVALPVELTAPQRLELARGFARELADRYRVVVDLAMHDPRPSGDPRNFHAHLLTTTRELTASGLGGKAQSEWNGTKRFQWHLRTNREELRDVRERWAALTNEAYRAASLAQRVDHRTLAAQGIDREPQPRIPYAAVQMERRGVRSEVAERIRAQYRARLMARAERSRALPQLGVEEAQRRARETWLQLRNLAQRTPDTAASAAPVAASRTRDHDFSL